MKKYAVMLIVAISMLVFSLGSSMVTVAITDLTQDLNTEIQYIQFAIALYALLIAAFILVGAKLAIMYGAKRIFVIGVILFAIGMLIASLSQNIVMFTLGYAVLPGLGAALIVPTGVILLMENYEGKARATAFAVFAAVYIGGAAIGPLVGGFFTTYISWQWAFFTLVVMDVILLVFSRNVKGQKGSGRAKLDVAGVLLSALGFILVTFGMMIITSYGLSIAAVPMITGVILLLLFVLWERRQGRKGGEPLLPFSLIKDKPYMAGVGVGAILSLTYGAVFFCIPLFVQSVLFLNAMESGLVLMPMTIGLMVMAFVSPRLTVKIRAKYLSIVGAGISIIGAVLLANSFSADMATSDMIPGLVVFGIGMGLATAQLQNLTLSSVRASETNEAAGLFNGGRNLGWAIGVAIVGAILIGLLLSSLTTGINGSTVFPQEIKDELTVLEEQSTKEMTREELEADLEQILGPPPNEYWEELERITDDSAGHSMQVTFYTIGGIMGVCLITSFLLSKRKLVADPDVPNLPPL